MSDLIKREDAKDAIKRASTDIDTDNYLKIMFAVDNVPSADRPKGEWVDEHEDGHGSWVGTCNQCHKVARVTNFCPDCGADMRGADNEE